MKVVILEDKPLRHEMFTTPEVMAALQPLVDEGIQLEWVADDCLVSDGDIPKDVILRLETEGPEWVVNSPNVFEAVKDADAVLVSFTPVGKAMLEKTENLKFVGVLRSGVENVNVPLCTEMGIPVSNCPGRSGEAVADCAVGMMIDINRGISQNNLCQRPGFDFLTPWRPMMMKHMTVGLLGFGMIAKMVAKRLKGFGCKIIAYDPYGNPDDAKELGVELLSMEEVLAQSDIVSVHVRLLPSTENLIGAKELGMMKPSAILVNSARAGLIDEEALIEALQQKKIRAAALDVFRAEPLPDDHPLRKLDNVLLTPHICGKAGNVTPITFEIMVEELLRLHHGEALKNTVKR